MGHQRPGRYHQYPSEAKLCPIGAINACRGCIRLHVAAYNSFSKSGLRWERYIEWYWEPYWLYYYWKNYFIIAVLTIVLVMAFFAVSVFMIRRRMARIAAWRRRHSRP
jgi:hypothetical protein